MLLLDLYCGAGGASKGYVDAGFEVLGVDIEPQPHYPYDFLQCDALKFLDDILRETDRYGIRAIHASPPCQAYSDLQKQNKREYPDLIGPTRERLRKAGLPYVIENVEGAPLLAATKLCGANDEYFPDLRVIRHRYFETTFPLDSVPCPKPRHPLVFTRDKRKPHYGKLNPDEDYVQVTGGGNCPVSSARDAMGINWMTKRELNEAIPPAYTRHVGAALRRFLAEPDRSPSPEPRGA